MEAATNQNFVECVRYTNNIGSTISTNICNGATATVTWGSMDWLWFIAMCGIGAVMLVFFAFLLSIIIKIIMEAF